MDEQLESPFGLINDHNLDSSNYDLTAFDHTKILDTESENLYDSGRKNTVYLYSAKATRLAIHEARSRAPGNRTPLDN